ncbi:J domain-containing protein [Homoserinimonas sp. A520]
MPESPLTPSPYDVLGVPPTATTHELRKAYRRMLREAHPDTGGSEARFHAVQRAWELVGTSSSRAAYDRGQVSVRHSAAQPGASWVPAPPRARRDSRPTARSYGHPGGWRRERYLTLVREWAGRGTDIADPYDAALVRSAPRELRHMLADALAEEATASTLATLGIGYTLWHDVATDVRAANPRFTGGVSKVDHVVLGPTGLFAVLSEDWGGPVRARKGDLIGEVLMPGERPMHQLSLEAKWVARAARVKFTALVIVVPDDATDESLMVLGKMRGVPSVVVQRSRLLDLLRNGLPGPEQTSRGQIGGTELFDIRTRLQNAIRFV